MPSKICNYGKLHAIIFFNKKLQCFEGFLRQKINKQSVLVLNLVEISIEFLVFIDLQIPEVIGLLPFRARLLLLNKHFVRCLRVTRARERFK